MVAVNSGVVNTLALSENATGNNTTTNSNITIDTIPPFYVLAFIMKIDEIEEA